MLFLAASALGACSDRRSPYNRYYASSGAYRAPGPPGDPWGPYIGQASRRFSIPQEWIRAVIHQESGGHEFLDGRPITSHSGAMGLMQLMPQTYADMSARYGLRSDPYEPHDNIMAGTGYISILARKYGAPAFLAAYNAGPQRLEAYLNDGRPLPNETVNYVASITPNLGTQVAMTGPLAAYASTQQLNASEAGPSAPVEDAPTQPAQFASAEPSTPRDSTGDVQRVWASRHLTSAAARTAAPDALAAPSATPCDPNAAYDPGSSCVVVASANNGALPPPAAIGSSPTATPPEPSAARTSAPFLTTSLPAAAIASQAAAAQADPSATVAYGYRRPGSYGDWSVQVGAFGSIGQARFAATMARQAAFAPLQAARIETHPTQSRGMTVWRARLIGISRSGAAQACATLAGQGMACMAVPPGR